MPQMCSISTCDSPSIATCLCCNEYLCRDHYIEHDDSLHLKLNDLTEQINKLASRLEAFNINKITSDFIIKLDKWRSDSYRFIDNFYNKKCQELHDYINEILNKSEEEMINLRLKIAKMVNVQQITDKNLKLLTLNIKNLQEQINQIEHISIPFNIDSLVINDNLIDINIKFISI
jgi:hypothetical protein